MKLSFTSKNGFTLIELMIVILIVGMLSVLAVNGYLDYRRTALLNLSANNIISQFYELKEKTIHGDFDSNKLEEIKANLEEEGEAVAVPEPSESKCYGMYFKNVGDLYEGYVFSQPFIGAKIWDAGTNNFIYQGCGRFSEVNLKPIELDEFVVIESVNPFEVVIRFVPPKGDMEVSFDGGIKFVSDPLVLANRSLIFRLNYGQSDDNRYRKDLKFDFGSGTVSINDVI